MGSITLSRGGNSVTLQEALDVERSVGRPNSELRTDTQEKPKYIDKKRSASDVFKISGELVSDTAETDAQTLVEDILRPRLVRSSLTLSFDNNLFGLGTYDVVPEGGQAGRISYQTGETGIVSVSSLTLRVVDNSD